MRNSLHVTRSLRAKSDMFRFMFPHFRLYRISAYVWRLPHTLVLVPWSSWCRPPFENKHLHVTPQIRPDLVEYKAKGPTVRKSGCNQPPNTASIFWTSFWSRPIKFRQRWGANMWTVFFRVGRPGVQRQAASVWCWSVFYNKYTFAGNFPLR